MISKDVIRELPVSIDQCRDGETTLWGKAAERPAHMTLCPRALPPCPTVRSSRLSNENIYAFRSLNRAYLYNKKAVRQ